MSVSLLAKNYVDYLQIYNIKCGFPLKSVVSRKSYYLFSAMCNTELITWLHE